MKTTLLVATALIFCFASAAGQGKLLANDPLTGLPLISATDSGKHIADLAYTHNQPTQMPGARICKSKFQGFLFSLQH